jgi:hypothetical protein
MAITRLIEASLILRKASASCCHVKSLSPKRARYGGAGTHQRAHTHVPPPPPLLGNPSRLEAASEPLICSTRERFQPRSRAGKGHLVLLEFPEATNFPNVD